MRRCFKMVLSTKVTCFTATSVLAVVVSCVCWVSGAEAAETWKIDFQGDSSHMNFIGQTDPINAPAHNIFEVQAINGNPSATEFDPSLPLLDDMGNPGVTFSITGEIFGWAGSSGADALLGDYLSLLNALGVDTDSIDFGITGLSPVSPYRLTFFAHDDGNPTRSIDFDINLGEAQFNQSNVDDPVEVVVYSDAMGAITGSAMNGEAEGNWAALHIAAIPEPSTFSALSALSLCMIGWRRKHQ